MKKKNKKFKMKFIIFVVDDAISQLLLTTTLSLVTLVFNDM